MGKARQDRRLARQTAVERGEAAGVEAVNDYATGGPRGDAVPTAAELRATLRSSWDEPAINAGVAKIDNCPAGYETAYYDAYERAARRHVLALAADLEAIEAAA